MTPEYFDIHSHIESDMYDADRNAVIDRLSKTNTHTISIGTDTVTSQKVVKLAIEHQNIYACIGIHPRDDASAVFDEKLFEELVKNPKVVAIGECGLDYFKLNDPEGIDKKRQKDLFEQQIHFAVKHGKPLMIHCRDAYEDATDMLENFSKEYGEKLWGNAHFFAGGLEIGKRLININFSLSFTGVLTFTHDYDEVVTMAPLSMIMSETDAPYVSPVPYRGQRNEPAYVCEVVKKIAQIKDEDFEVVKKALVENALKRFHIA